MFLIADVHESQMFLIPECVIVMAIDPSRSSACDCIDSVSARARTTIAKISIGPRAHCWRELEPGAGAIDVPNILGLTSAGPSRLGGSSGRCPQGRRGCGARSSAMRASRSPNRVAPHAAAGRILTGTGTMRPRARK